MVSSAAQKLLIGLGVGTGLYYGAVGFQIASVAKEERYLREAAELESKAAQRSEAQQQVEEAAVRKLEQQLQLEQQEVGALEAEITVARQRVVELEEMRATRLQAAAETAGAIETAQSKLGRLVEEIRRHREAATAAQAALGAAHVRVTEKQQLTNPLNHPMVRGLLGRA